MYHTQLRSKLLNKASVLASIRPLQQSGKKIVFTNGVFDILHPGHVDYLCQARDCGDFMVLGLNSDASVRKLNKAPDRPINTENSRALVLAGLACVDAIVVFEEETPYELIKFLQPDVLVKGDDYQAEQIAGFDIVKAKGGEVRTIPLLKGFSTTSLIKKIRS